MKSISEISSSQGYHHHGQFQTNIIYGCWHPLALAVALMISVGATFLSTMVSPSTFASRSGILIAGDTTFTTNVTLRQVLVQAGSANQSANGLHLALAPAFFGFYGYFGALSAWEEAVDPYMFQPASALPAGQVQRIRAVTGASAGAMAAILLAAGVSPIQAAEFCTHNITLTKFADFPAFLAVFRGNAFQSTMHQFLREARPQQSLLLQDAVLPVAVSAFDLQTMQGKILTRGSMARAARASATFPFLFQPVGWKRDDYSNIEYTLIDGALGDPHGWTGLTGFVLQNKKPEAFVPRIIHIQMGPSTPPGPSEFLKNIKKAAGKMAWAVPDKVEVISIVISNLPACGPWALKRGPVAVKAAREAMIASLDRPLLQRFGAEQNHYELHIDASSYW